MLVSETMGRAVASCDADATVGGRVPHRLTEEDFGAAPVTRHGRLMRIIEREILRSVSPGNSPEQTKVNDLMTPDPDPLEPDISVKDPANWVLAAG